MVRPAESRFSSAIRGRTFETWPVSYMNVVTTRGTPSATDVKLNQAAA